MMRYTMNKVKKGLKVVGDDKPYVIVEVDFRKPGKGQAFTHVRGNLKR